MKSLVLPLVLVAILSFGCLYWVFTQNRVRVPHRRPIQTTRPGETGSPRPEADPTELIRKAEEAVRAGRFGEAVTLLEGISRSPDPKTHAVLGEAFRGLGSLASAANSYEWALGEKRDPGLLLPLANIYAGLGRSGEALAAFQELGKARVEAKVRERILMDWAQTASEARDYVAAMEILKKAGREFPGNEANLLRSLQVALLLPPQDAAEEIPNLRTAGEKLASQSFPFRLALGRAYLRAGDRKAARDTLREAGKLNPQEAIPHLLLFRLANEDGQIQEGLEELATLVRIGGTDGAVPCKPEALFQSALEARKLGRLDLAFLFMRVSVLREKSLLALHDQGLVAEVGDFVGKAGTEGEKGFMNAFQAYFVGDLKGARDRLEGILPKIQDPHLRRDANLLSEICGQAQAKEDAYRRSLTEQEEAKRKAEVASAAGLSEAPKAMPGGSPDEKGKLAKIEAIKKKARASKGDVTAQYEAGRQLHAMGDLEGAKEAFGQVLAISPGRWEAHHCLALIAMQEKDHRECSAHLTEALKIVPGKSSLLSLQGVARLNTGDIPGALESARKALELDPKDGQAHLVLADIYYKSKREDDALAEVKKGIAEETDPRILERLNALKRTITGE